MSQALLSEAELELMHVLWLGGPVTVREVMAVVQDGRAYTTFSTILRILEQKGFATSERVGRAHRYRAVLGREAYETRKLKHVDASVFRGDAVALVRCLVEAEELGSDQHAALRALIDPLEPRRWPRRRRPSEPLPGGWDT